MVWWSGTIITEQSKCPICIPDNGQQESMLVKRPESRGGYGRGRGIPSRGRSANRVQLK
jgi:hypothetical protein